MALFGIFPIVSRLAQFPRMAVPSNRQAEGMWQSSRLQEEALKFIPPEFPLRVHVSGGHEDRRRDIATR
jgi:hypothetical protein